MGWQDDPPAAPAAPRARPPTIRKAGAAIPEVAASWRDDPPAPSAAGGGPADFAQKAGQTAADAVTGAEGIASFADPLIAGVGALGSYAVPYTEGRFFDPRGGGPTLGSDASLGERFKAEMQRLKAGRAEGAQRSPIATGVGQIAGTVAAAPALAMLPGLSAASGALPMAARMAAGALDATALAGGSAALSNIEGDPLKASSEAMSNPMVPMLGAAAPLAAGYVQQMPAAGTRLKQLLGSGVRKMLPRVTPTPAAEYLRSQGVDLTTGQMNPDSAVAQLEEGATSLPVVGPGIKGKRANAMDQWRQAAVDRALPPGMESPPAGPVQERLAAIHHGFEPAYAKIRGEQVIPVSPEVDLPLRGNGKTPGAFDAAVADPSVAIDDATRHVAQKYLDNQASILPEKVQPVDAGDLLKIRSNIRGAIRSARAQQKYDLAHLLSNAEQTVTETIGAQLSPEAAQHLADTDRQYARYMTIENAAGRAGPDSEFTPRQLAQAVRKQAGTRATVQGNAGDIQDLAQAGAEVFDARVPMTGRALLGELPAWAGGKFAHATAAHLMNTPTGQRMLLREPYPPPGPPPSLQVTDEMARGLMLANALRNPTMKDEHSSENTAALVDALRTATVPPKKKRSR